MRFSLLSDLHLEFAPMDLPGGDVLLLAGDITVAHHLQKHRTDKQATVMMDRMNDFFGQCRKYDQVYYIMGNHEHYDGVFDNTATILREFLQGYNVTLLDKESVYLEENICLWGGTLWTNMDNSNPHVMLSAQHGMNDYNLIRREGVAHPYGKNYYTLRPGETINEHNLAMESLAKCLKDNPDRKMVVMTHMAPSSKSSHPRYGIDNPLNWAYYSELSEFILNNPRIAAWVHGHTHDSHDYMVGDTRVMCNPRGYAHPMRKNEQENELFNIDFTFEV